MLASIPYVVDVVKGRVKPERISWLLWAALGATFFVGALQNDGAVLYTLGNLLIPVIIFVLSLKYGVGGKSWFDKICLVIAAVAFVLMFVVDNALYGLVLALIVDAIGSILTIRKLLKDRTSEPKLIWGVFAIAGILSIIALENYSIVNLLFPVYVVIVDSIVFLIAKPRKDAKVSKSELSEIEKL